MKAYYPIFSFTLFTFLLFAMLFEGKAQDSTPFKSAFAVTTYSRIPSDTPLDATHWTGGFWSDKMDKLTNVYIPGIIDTMFLNPVSGSSFRNFLRVTGSETGGVIGREWGDGDCYFVLDAAARMYAYNKSSYLIGKLNYWIPIIENCRRPDGMVDTYNSLTGLKSSLHYNIGHMYAASNSIKNGAGIDSFRLFATDVLKSFYNANGYIGDNISSAYCNLYKETGDSKYLNSITQYYQKSPMGVPLRQAEQVFGHSTFTHNYLIGATEYYDCTGDTTVLQSLRLLADNTMKKKTFITGAVGSVRYGQRPAQTIKGVVYPGATIKEAVGVEYFLPNDSSYNESCSLCLDMEWMYRMFRVTGDAKYMDAVERAMYNSIPGSVELNRSRFFYANPQEQTSKSNRYNTQYETIKPSDQSLPDNWLCKHYTWKRLSPMQVSCCPPKVLRALSMVNEMAYSINQEGLWVNLFGNNTFAAQLPMGGNFECHQISNYPWDGKVELVIDKQEGVNPFTLFFRIPSWLQTPATIKLNGTIIESSATGGQYWQLQRLWQAGDKLEVELPMPVRTLAASPAITENRGKVAIMRGPIVYCLENTDLPDGTQIDSVFVSGIFDLTPTPGSELGGIMKLTGSLYIKKGKPAFPSFQLTTDQSIPYQDIDLTINGAGLEYTQVSMIPYYARLNRAGNYFKVWLPVYDPALGVSDISISRNLTIFPNPTSDRISLSMEALREIDFVNIVSLSGTHISRFENLMTNNQIPVDYLYPGMYLLEVGLKNEKAVFMKFIKN
jgi:DUF1680 family protein